MSGLILPHRVVGSFHGMSGVVSDGDVGVYIVLCVGDVMVSCEVGGVLVVNGGRCGWVVVWTLCGGCGMVGVWRGVCDVLNNVC